MKTALTVIDWSKQEYQIEVKKNKSIKVDCFYKNHIAPKETSVTFNIGDQAEYDSYNLSYIGTITGITEKTVTITAYPGTRNAEVRRLKIGDFCSRNWDFNLEKKQKENNETSMHI